MPYEYTEAQRRFLRRKFAEDRELETSCDCAGCDKCRGFVRNCTCDHDLSFLRMRHDNRQQENGQGMADRRQSESTGESSRPGNVDQADFERYGY